jgi:signal peptidase I
MPRQRSKIANIISWLVLGFAFALFAAALLFATLGKSTENIYLFGHKPFIIASGSMETEYMTNSTVIIKQGDFKQVAVGDVVAFHSATFDGKLVFHRVVKRSDQGFVTKGDNSRQPDAQVVTADNYVGHEVFHTNLTAHYINQLNQPFGVLTMVILPIIALVLLGVGVHLFRRWSADPLLKCACVSATLLTICLIALFCYWYF